MVIITEDVITYNSWTIPENFIRASDLLFRICQETSFHILTATIKTAVKS